MWIVRCNQARRIAFVFGQERMEDVGLIPPLHGSVGPFGRSTIPSQNSEMSADNSPLANVQ
jgi:hypothetical protein